MFHRHRWREMQRVYTGPSTIKLGGLECSEHMAERMMFGVTTILQSCETCGELKNHEVLGDARPQQLQLPKGLATPTSQVLARMLGGLGSVVR